MPLTSIKVLFSSQCHSMKITPTDAVTTSSVSPRNIFPLTVPKSRISPHFKNCNFLRDNQENVGVHHYLLDIYAQGNTRIKPNVGYMAYASSIKTQNEIEISNSGGPMAQSGACSLAYFSVIRGSGRRGKGVQQNCKGGLETSSSSTFGSRFGGKFHHYADSINAKLHTY